MLHPVNMMFLSLVALLAGSEVMGIATPPHCPPAREKGFRCYSDLYRTTVHPTKQSYIQEAMDDPMFGQAVIGYWEDMVSAFHKCRKFDNHFDECAGPTPDLPRLFEHDLPLFAKAKFECIVETERSPLVNASMEIFFTNAENCYKDEMPDDLCMPNDRVIHCFHQNMGRLRRSRGFDPISARLTKVHQDIEKHFRQSEPLYGPCADCFRQVGMECMPQPQRAKVYQRKELEQISCISAYKTKQMTIYNEIFANCMSDRGFQVNANMPLIPNPSKWSGICSYGDTLLKHDRLDGDL